MIIGLHTPREATSLNLIGRFATPRTIILWQPSVYPPIFYFNTHYISTHEREHASSLQALHQAQQVNPILKIHCLKPLLVPASRQDQKDKFTRQLWHRQEG